MNCDKYQKDVKEIIADLKDWGKRQTAAFERYFELGQEKPIEPKHRHTY